MTDREQLIDWGYAQTVVDAMSNEECEGEVEAVQAYPEG